MDSKRFFGGQPSETRVPPRGANQAEEARESLLPSPRDAAAPLSSVEAIFSSKVKKSEQRSSDLMQRELNQEGEVLATTTTTHGTQESGNSSFEAKQNSVLPSNATDDNLTALNKKQNIVNLRRPSSLDDSKSSAVIFFSIARNDDKRSFREESETTHNGLQNRTEESSTNLPESGAGEVEFHQPNMVQNSQSSNQQSTSGRADTTNETQVKDDFRSKKKACAAPRGTKRKGGAQDAKPKRREKMKIPATAEAEVEENPEDLEENKPGSALAAENIHKVELKKGKEKAVDPIKVSPTSKPNKVTSTEPRHKKPKLLDKRSISTMTSSINVNEIAPEQPASPRPKNEPIKTDDATEDEKAVENVPLLDAESGTFSAKEDIKSKVKSCGNSRKPSNETKKTTREKSKPSNKRKTIAKFDEKPTSGSSSSPSPPTNDEEEHKRSKIKEDIKKTRFPKTVAKQMHVRLDNKGKASKGHLVSRGNSGSRSYAKIAPKGAKGVRAVKNDKSVSFKEVVIGDKKKKREESSKLKPKTKISKLEDKGVMSKKYLVSGGAGVYGRLSKKEISLRQKKANSQKNKSQGQTYRELARRRRTRAESREKSLKRRKASIRSRNKKRRVRKKSPRRKKTGKSTRKN